MKAVVYEKNNPDGQLVLREIEKPVPQMGEVLVKIIATAVNAADYRSMQMGSIPKRRIFGSDIAGTVEAVGKNVTRLKVGDAVAGDISGCGLGGFAEYVAVPEDVLAVKPTSVSFDDAAAVPMAAVTALQGLRDLGNIQAGQKVLVYGAGGGVGTFAVQLAKHFGADVTAVCHTNNVELVRSLGADQVVDYKREDITESHRQYDLILAVNGSRSMTDYTRMLAHGGTAVVVGGSLSQVIKTMLFGRWRSSQSKKIRMLAAKPCREDLEFIIKLVDDGKVKPVIERNFPLDQTAEAIRYLSQGHAKGKVIINVC